MFDVLPLHGHLQPGDQQLVTVCFYGHKDASREVVALCYVEEGPTYEIKLRGEASIISYNLDPTHVDFGLQVRTQGSFTQSLASQFFVPTSSLSQIEMFQLSMCRSLRLG